eukprot:SAG22_NODE_1094_length_5587_cov_6.950580_6_plen_117_part_00
MLLLHEERGLQQTDSALPFVLLKARALLLRQFAKLLLDEAEGVLPLVELGGGGVGGGVGGGGGAFAALAHVSWLIPSQMKRGECRAAAGPQRSPCDSSIEIAALLLQAYSYLVHVH